MSKCFYNNQKIRHIIKGSNPNFSHTKIGYYNIESDSIIHNGESITLYKFVFNHYKKVIPGWNPWPLWVNAWKECECEDGSLYGKWISTYRLPSLE